MKSFTKTSLIPSTVQRHQSNISDGSKLSYHSPAVSIDKACNFTGKLKEIRVIGEGRGRKLKCGVS